MLKWLLPFSFLADISTVAIDVLVRCSDAHYPTGLVFNSSFLARVCAERFYLETESAFSLRMNYLHLVQPLFSAEILKILGIFFIFYFKVKM